MRFATELWRYSQLGTMNRHGPQVILWQRLETLHSTLWLFNMAMQNGPFIAGDFPWLR
jgi:hypothetical protein